MLTAARLKPGPPALLHVLRMVGLQYGRFALVGLGATIVHVLVYAATIEWLALPPLLANALGFATGVNLSFVGHRRWTFRTEAPAASRRSLFRFWAVALIGLALNTAFVQIVTGTLMLHYIWSIPLIAGVTPVLTFTLSRSWAFRP
ncbi:MAG: GtrA family protein [Geminicoccaceae bacterium]